MVLEDHVHEATIGEPGSLPQIAHHGGPDAEAGAPALQIALGVPREAAGLAGDAHRDQGVDRIRLGAGDARAEEPDGVVQAGVEELHLVAAEVGHEQVAQVLVEQGAGHTRARG